MTALLLMAVLQDAEAIRTCIERLGSDDVGVRNAAEKELLAFPVEWTPALAEAAVKSGDPEVRTRVARSTVPAAWIPLLRGTIGGARRDLETVRALERDPRDLDLQEIFLRLDDRPPGEIRSRLLPLLGSEDPGERDAALFGLKAHPPADLAPVVRLLADPKVGRRAAELLALAGDGSAVPAAFELVMAGNDAAARVLRRFGASGREKDLARIPATSENRRSPVVAILERTGGAEANDALLGMLDGENGALDAASALARAGDPRVLPRLKAWAFRKTGDTYWDHWLLPLGDRDWAMQRLRTVLDGTAINVTGRARWYASVAGDRAREPILTALKNPASKLSLRKEILPALGVVAKAEDVPYLLELLRDDRLVQEAGEALDMTGHPARARPMMEAFKRVGYAGLREPHVLALPPEAIEDDLFEIFSDPKGYSWQVGIALPLVARRPAPRLREALFDAGLGREILAATVAPGDRPRLQKLRASKEVELRAFGLYLALRLGDETAVPELAELLVTRSTLALTGWPDPPGTAWPKAVEEAWRRSGRENWTLERWLAARGVADALDRVRKRAPPVGEPVHRPNPEDEDGAILARRGEPGALERLLRRSLYGPLPPRTEQAFLAGADRAWRLRTLAAARRERLRAQSGVLRLAALAAVPEGIPLYRAALSPADDHPEWSGPADAVTIPCLEALASLGAKDAVPEIRPHLRSSLARIAGAAALALARLGDRDSIPRIASLLDRPDETANEEWDLWRPRPDGPSRRLWDAALQALEILTGEKAPGDSTLERRAWWKERHAKPRDP